MSFIADLHIHSRFSRATSRSLTLASLAGWAACKGIAVLGSGDFTHPAWRAEIAENLRFDEESGLYRLAIEPELPPEVESLPSSAPLFCLQTEISSIYRRAGRVRKVHNLVFMPNLEAAEKFSRRLALIGNLNSDGRPILGLDSRDLLEIVLECDEDAHLVPAHIWTPWFSLFGSRSGFDSIEECFGDLSAHIFALETGLSSDPPMNRLVSALDGRALISSSDAHSGANLGREASIFSGKPNYRAMFDALRKQALREIPEEGECRFLGTMEFYPEEGKYHLDGHRACNVSLEPSESAALGDICPVCGKPLTVGVLHRVMELADRQSEPVLKNEPEARMLVPLPEILAEILQCGAASRRARDIYVKMLRDLGPELDILCNAPLESIYAAFEPLGEAIARTRRGDVRKIAGYDGQFGKIRIFDESDLRQIDPALPGLCKKRARISDPVRTANPDLAKTPKADKRARDIVWSGAQLEVIGAGDYPVFVSAGPGAGKTRVLVGRILHLLKNGAKPEKILAITFTRRAAAEMRERLAENPIPHCDTLHALALALRGEATGEPRFMLLPEDAAREIFARANPELTRAEAEHLWREITVAIEKLKQPGGAARLALDNYLAAKRISDDFSYLDYNDLLLWLLDRAKRYRGRFKYVLVDEIQDFSRLQLEIVRKLLPCDGRGFFGIGDPDQAIYGFRGAQGQDEASLREIWPELQVFYLGQSFRAGQEVLDLAASALGNKEFRLCAAFGLPARLQLFHARSDREEAEWIARKIGDLLGATSHTLMDGSGETLAPGDIAVLTRLGAQMPLLAKYLNEAGIPVRAPLLDAFWEDGEVAAFLAHAATALADENFLSFLSKGKRPDKIAPQDMLAKIGAACGIGDINIFSAGSPFRALCAHWKKCGGWKNFFAELAWLSEAERISEKAETVRLLTIHASKGLEFEAVFLPGLEDGLLPFWPAKLGIAKSDASENAANDRMEEESSHDSSHLAEERRLLYVGITRAARMVFASCAANRQLFGRALHLAPSPFLAPMRILMRETRLKRHTREVQAPLSLLDNLGKKG